MPLYPPPVLLTATALALSPIGVGATRAQSMEPRAYSNSPIGTNFLLAGLGYSQGDVTVDASLHTVGAPATRSVSSGAVVLS
jgi:hypothetical protein